MERANISFKELEVAAVSWNRQQISISWICLMAARSWSWQLHVLQLEVVSSIQKLAAISGIVSW
jgi:hypothetical protein